jgi:small-conductance mechanosensitive channel
MTFEAIWNHITEAFPVLAAALPVALLILLGGVVLNAIIGRSLTLLARRTSLDEADIIPARKVLHWLIRVITIIIILGVFGFELGGIWSMISTILAMVAIGFVAVWSLLSHTSATVLLVIVRPFQIGDDISIPSENVEGRVVDLNFFYTTLLSHEGCEWRIPNNLFFQKVLKRSKRDSSTSLAVQLNNPQPAAISPPPPPASDPSSETKAKP